LYIEEFLEDFLVLLLIKSPTDGGLKEVEKVRYKLGCRMGCSWVESNLRAEK